MQSVTKGTVSEESNFVPLELLKKHGENMKKSVPVPSAGPLYSLLSTVLVFLGFLAYLTHCVSYLFSTFYALLSDGPLMSRANESPESPRNPGFSREKRWFCSGCGRIRTRYVML